MFEEIFPYLSGGIDELGILPFEPLMVKRINISKNNGEVVQLNGSFDDLKIRGPSNATIMKAKLNLVNRFLNFDLKIPRLRINATYNLYGNILLLPLIGTGNIQILLKDIKTSVSSKIELEQMPRVSIYYIKYVHI